jgi:hypothetical protein
MQNVLSSKSRMDRVVSDIVFDFSIKPRLSSERPTLARDPYWSGSHLSCLSRMLLPDAELTRYDATGSAA